MELHKRVQSMEINKSYWIRCLRDEDDDRAVKRQFIKDLGCDNAEEAISYLEECEQTTFVGPWFLTDEELDEERSRLEDGKVSVFMEETHSGEIKLLSERVSVQLEDLEKNCGGLMRLLHELSKTSPEDHVRIVNSLATLVG